MKYAWDWILSQACAMKYPWNLMCLQACALNAFVTLFDDQICLWFDAFMSSCDGRCLQLIAFIFVILSCNENSDDWVLCYLVQWKLSEIECFAAMKDACNSMLLWQCLWLNANCFCKWQWKMPATATECFTTEKNAFTYFCEFEMPAMDSWMDAWNCLRSCGGGCCVVR